MQHEEEKLRSYKQHTSELYSSESNKAAWCVDRNWRKRKKHFYVAGPEAVVGLGRSGVERELQTQL